MAQIPLDLSDHCIQTETKRVYNRMVSRSLKSGDIDEATEAGIELLKEALETLDFPRLRSQHAALAGGGDDEVAISRNENDAIMVLINQEPVDPPKRGE
ncbi:MAG: hypothetical protein SWH68_16605 [Thermodesulfobacteriota bacterium]|nr:hypothetical protein [Thermodesulfobacteriota bacterium]